MADRHAHESDCFGLEEHVCPSCHVASVFQVRLRCGALDTSPLLECVTCSLACPDCPSEVRVTEGTMLRARVIHSATCPWYRRYLDRQVAGRIPCGTVVTHRGPYKRDPAARAGGPHAG